VPVQPNVLTPAGDPVRFHNLDGSGPPALDAVLRWAALDRVTGRRHRDTRPFTTPRVENDGAALRANTTAPLLCWVGHATWVVQLAGVNLLVDPVWCPSLGGLVRRNVAPGVALEALPRLDAVLVTHNHRDHLDAWTMKRLSGLGVGVVVVPAGLGPTVRPWVRSNVVELGWWETYRLGPVTVTFVPAQHWSRRSLADTNRSAWGGYVVEGGGRRVHHLGDSALFPGFREIARRVGSPDVALVPVGAYEPGWFMRRQHLSPEDAVQAGLDLGAGRIVAMHWGTFQLSDEWLGEPPQRFLQAGQGDARVVERLTVVPVGGVVTLA
jgi:L-ascorbate metabolism protein UlaG (beta-lactamase superfamily)